MNGSGKNRGQFPYTRMRRNRKASSVRKLVQESSLQITDLIQPVFIIDGNNKTESIASMPGIERLSPDHLLSEAQELYNLGIQAIAVFPVIEKNKKSLNAEESFNENGLVQNAIKLLKSNIPELTLITDVALDPYTIHGHDGILNQKNIIDNDLTNETLVKQALSHAVAGADIIAPSDMMDGRVLRIRENLENHNFHDAIIMSYASKYASNYYGPFRDAIGSNDGERIDKSTYQIDIHNANEALSECEQDLQEGADILLIKPGMPYLDIITKVKQKFGVPTFAYQVSGEYSMHCLAFEKGLLEREATLLESLISFKRAGADAILTYFAKEAAILLKG